MMDRASRASSNMRRKGVFMKGQVKLEAYMNYGLLTVHVIEARQLSSTWKSRPDTFVMLSLIPEDNSTTPSRCRTTLVRDNNKPTYDEKFSFEVSEEDIHKRLLVSIWHRDGHSGLHESLGCTSFGLRHLHSGERQVHGWYYLLNDDVGRKKHLRVATRDRPPRPTTTIVHRVPSVNSIISGLEKIDITVRRAPYGGFGFTLVDACPVKVGRVDSGSYAESAGLQKDDIVVRVNYQNVSRSTSISVAKCIKQSGSMVCLEIHRQQQPVPMETEHTLPTAHESDDSGNNSVQEFTVCDDRAALIDSAISVDTRRQASLHRLLCLEENFVDVMNSGIHLYSRPLRHCILTTNQHAALFQNIEKIVCISQYHVGQIINNLPSHAGSDDDDTDTSFVGENDLTNVIGMIYRSKMSVLCQAYSIYADGLSHASKVLARLEMNEQFRHFMLKTADKNDLRLCEFINRPLRHIQELTGILQTIRETTHPTSHDYAVFSQVISGFQSVVDSIQSAEPLSTSVTSINTSHTTIAIPPPVAGRRVPMMGSLVLKRAASVKSSSSGFGSGSSSHHSSDCDSVFADMELTR